MKHDKPDHPAPEDGQPTVFAAMLNGPSGAMERSANLFGKSVRTLQEEGMKFLSRRMEENARTAKEMAACRNFPDLLAVQQKWFADTARAYGEEWMRCGELMTEMLEEDGKRDSRPRGRSEH